MVLKECHQVYRFFVWGVIQSALAPHRYIFVTMRSKERNVYVTCLYTIKCCLLSLLFMLVFDIQGGGGTCLMMHILDCNTIMYAQYYCYMQMFSTKKSGLRDQCLLDILYTLCYTWRI